jgi:hypothetical protein
MKAAADKQRPTRPVFIVYEEGHNFAPAGEALPSPLRITTRPRLIADDHLPDTSGHLQLGLSAAGSVVPSPGTAGGTGSSRRPTLG